MIEWIRKRNSPPRPEFDISIHLCGLKGMKGDQVLFYFSNSGREKLGIAKGSGIQIGVDTVKKRVYFRRSEDGSELKVCGGTHNELKTRVYVVGDLITQWSERISRYSLKTDKRLQMQYINYSKEGEA